MPYTSPNQKTITIHREPLGGNFLGVNNDNWKNAARILGAQAFLLYIYFASNKDGFKLALSPKAIQQEIGMPPSTFRDQLKKLECLGFLMPAGNNVYHFYETPARVSHSQNTDDALNSNKDKNTAFVDASTSHVHEETPEDIQIYINNQDRIINRPKGISDRVEPMSIDQYMKSTFNF